MLRTCTRRAPRIGYLGHSARQLHTTPNPLRSSRLALGLGASAAGLGVAGMTIYADSNTAPPGATTLSSLARSYLVYSLCSVPPLVNNSPSILKTCSNIPGLRELSEAVVRRTFFAQFVGGDSLPDTLPLITSLRQQNMGTLLVYSVEADGDVKGAQWEKNVQEILSSVNFAGDFEDTQSGGRKTWVAVKLTALLPSPDSLKRLSTFLLASRPKSNVPYPGTPDVTDVAFFSKGQGSLPVKGLSSEDITALHELYQSLRQICAQAKKRGVRITVDAEHSWYQPGIDAFVTALSREFNQPNAGSESKIQNGQPVVYGTYQAYLRRTPLHLSRAMEDAKRHGYSLGVKLVRGAYHGQEIAYHERRMAESKSDINVEPYPAVWLRKEETDRCFDEAAELLIRHTASSLNPRRPQQPKLGMLFGTHNKQSCQKVLDCMVSSGLAHKNEDGLAEVKPGVEDMVCFGQLYGMRDELTNWIASVFKSESPMAFKYLPYGALAEVMPYLSRRAIENQSVLSGEGGAAEERRRAGDLIHFKKHMLCLSYLERSSAPGVLLGGLDIRVTIPATRSSDLRGLYKGATCITEQAHTTRGSHPSRNSQWRAGTLGIGLGTCALSWSAIATIYADTETEPVTSLGELLRGYFVYSICSVPTLVNWSPTILETCASVPGVRELSQAVVRRTFFAQFVGGDTCEDTLPLITSLREQNKGTLLAYSVEVDENQGGRADQWKRNVEEMIASVEFAGDFEDTRKGSRKTWVAIKLSALVPSADSLKRMSKFLLKSRPADDVPFPGTPGSFDMVVFRGVKEPLIKAGLTEEDIESLRVLYEDLRTVCNRAKERGIRLIFDAEHTWYQPGIDAFVLALSREFNKPSSSGRFNEQPLVYATYQAYLKRTPLHLARSIEDAQAFGYTLGVKLVRGAYYDKETAEYPESQSPNCPVWAEKSQTDALSGSQNTILTGAGWLGKPTRTSLPQTDIGILFGTHNALSCTYILENLVDAGLAHRSGDKEVVIADGVEERLCFGQLYGMRDDLTDWMVHTVKANSPMVLKYVPYGALADASDAVLG
ncbi:Proline dehydrogenase, partial [Rhizoctonia solani]